MILLTSISEKGAKMKTKEIKTKIVFDKKEQEQFKKAYDIITKFIEFVEEKDIDTITTNDENLIIDKDTLRITYSALIDLNECYEDGGFIGIISKL